MKQLLCRLSQRAVLGIFLITGPALPFFRSSLVLAESHKGGRKTQQIEGRTFLQELYVHNESRIHRKFLPRYREAVAAGMTDNPSNMRTFMVALFFHELLRANGTLGNQFVVKHTCDWKPDQLIREAIIQGGISARCDEFEMAYKALLGALGIQSRISLVLPFHVNTEIQAEGGYLRVDNAFSQFAFRQERAVDQPPEDGVYDIKETNDLAIMGTFYLRRVEVLRIAKHIRFFLEIQ